MFVVMASNSLAAEEDILGLIAVSPSANVAATTHEMVCMTKHRLAVS